jgi:uncharacterized phage protein (TIGR02218 family)
VSLQFEQEITTYCYCWVVTRRDGVKLAYTNHDKDILADLADDSDPGPIILTFKSSSGFDATSAQQTLGLSVDNMELVSALDADEISETDVAAGRYDDAFIELYRANWLLAEGETTIYLAFEQKVLTGYLGEMTINGIQYTAELRSLASRLNQKIGRVYQRTCDAVFGDSRCGFDKDTVTFPGAVVLASNPRVLVVSGIDAYDNEYFSRGVLTWTSGLNNGVTYDVELHTKVLPNVILELWTPVTEIPEVGDTFDITAGCYQTASVCKDKFNNLANYQGFPHIPGNDVITTYPSKGGSNQDGGSRID